MQKWRRLTTATWYAAKDVHQSNWIHQYNSNSEQTMNRHHGGASSLALRISVTATIIDRVTLSYVLLNSVKMPSIHASNPWMQLSTCTSSTSVSILHLLANLWKVSPRVHTLGVTYALCYRYCPLELRAPTWEGLASQTKTLHLRK